jgi:D-3-phosphoglycerate dehydrogenase / 2-oxoglutarate reductase
MLVVRNDDRPGMIGVVGTELGAAGVSISSMTVGPSASSNTALMVLSTDRQVPDETFERLKAAGGILDLHRVTATP